MKKDNRGFTLVELLVAVAILGVVSLMALGFVSAGASSYRSVSNSVNLQVQSQLTMTQIREYMVDCNDGICFEDADDTLYIINSDDTGYTAHIITFNAAEGGIYLGSASVDVTGSSATIPDTTSYLLSNYVSGFNVAISADGSSADVTIDFDYAGRTYTGTQTIALRNAPRTASTIQLLLESYVAAPAS